MSTNANEMDNEDPFAHLGSDFDGAAVAIVKTPPTADTGFGTFPETCPKCRGTGRFRSYAGRDCGPCHACKGKGRNVFKTPPEDRARARANAAVRAAQSKLGNWEAFQAAHPVVAGWITESAASFQFAAAMLEAVGKYGSLTENQMAACQRAVLKREAFREANKARVENAKEIDASLIEAAFAKASSVLAAPKLRVAGFIISRAKASSANPGALYVKSNGYLGKITGGKFFPTRECTAEKEAEFRTVAADPKDAAIKYGRETHSCACCGKELTNPESIERGIGPICAENFGW